MQYFRKLPRYLKLILSISLFVALALVAVINVPVVQDKLFSKLAGIILKQKAPSIEGLRIVVCGSASPLGNDPSRAQACLAVLTPTHFYIFDVGAGSPQRIGIAQLPLERLDGVFLTHFHSDHISGLGDVNLNAWVMGNEHALKVYGPEGVEQIVNGFNMAYGLDQQYRIEHHGIELLPTEVATMLPQQIDAGVVLEDGDLKITAFKVNHAPVSPAFGYRIDYRDRSIIISGDTIVSESLFTVAQGADLLFHDALSHDLLDILIPNAKAAGRDRIAKIMQDVKTYHADVANLEERAKAAGIKQLVLYHLVPVPPNRLAEKMFRRSLSNNTILAKDLMFFNLPDHNNAIEIDRY